MGDVTHLHLSEGAAQQLIEGVVDTRLQAVEDLRARAYDEKRDADAKKKRAASIAKMREAVDTYWDIQEAVEKARVQSLDDIGQEFVVIVTEAGARSISREAWTEMPLDQKELVEMVALFRSGLEKTLPPAAVC